MIYYLEEKRNIMKTILYSIFLLVLLGLFSCSSNQKSESKDSEKEQVIEESSVDEVEVEGKELSYATENTTMKGYLAYPTNLKEKVPGVLVVHEWWGHNDYARKRAEMLAELGYVALAVDMFGEGKTAGHPEDAGKFTQEVFSNVDEAKARFAEAMKVLKNTDNVDSSKIAAIGYCFGGSVAMSMANAGMDLKAVAAFHSGVQLPIQPEKDKVETKILVQNGADDPFISPESVESFKSAMEAANVDYEYITYEGAVHSYTSPIADSLGKKFELPLAYNAQADSASWERMKSFFHEVL